MTRVIVCGGRNCSDAQGVFDALSAFHLCGDGPITELITGGATGVDDLAARWATLNRDEVKLTVVPADWKSHGKSAGPIRNQKMLAMNPDRVLAFTGGKGTADMVSRAHACLIPVERLTP